MKKWLIGIGEFLAFAVLTLALLALMVGLDPGTGLRAFILQHGCALDAINLMSDYGDHCAQPGPDGSEAIAEWWQRTRFLTRAAVSLSVALASALIARTALASWPQAARLAAYIAVPGLAFAVGAYMGMNNKATNPPSLALGLGGLAGIALGCALLYRLPPGPRLRGLVTPGAKAVCLWLALLSAVTVAGEAWRHSDAHFVDLLPHDRVYRNALPEGVIAVAKSRHQGVLNKSGDWLIEPVFDEIKLVSISEHGMLLRALRNGQHEVYWLYAGRVDHAGPFLELIPVERNILARTDGGNYVLMVIDQEKLKPLEKPLAYDAIGSPRLFYDSSRMALFTRFIVTRQNKSGTIEVAHSPYDAKGPDPVAELISPAAHELRWLSEDDPEHAPDPERVHWGNILVASEGGQWLHVSADGRLAKQPKLFDRSVPQDSPEAKAELERFKAELKN